MNLRGVILWIVIVLLLGAVWWLASERNERHYSLSTNGTQLLVSKGHFFPTGTSTLQEKPYEPFTIPAGEKVPFAGDVDYDDQNALDRALFDILYGWAKDLTKKDAPAAQSIAERASALPGLTAAQLGQLQALRAELSYSAAHDELQQAVKLIGEARRKLQNVKDAGADHALEAGQALPQLQQLSDQLQQLAK